jgi:hypothetical protein
MRKCPGAQRKGIEMFRSLGCFAIGSIVIALAFIASAENPPECYPACRPGFECHNGNCISKCNPPCPGGQNCTDSGDCIPLTTPGTAASKQPKDIHCAAVYVVRPHMDSTNVPGNFQESELLNASNLIAVEITKKTDSRSRIITNEDIDAIQNCNVKMIVVKVIIYYKKPAVMGQFVGVLTVSISNYDSPRQKTPVSTQEFTAEGNRHWGDSVPLENTIEAICKKISRKYKP